MERARRISGSEVESGSENINPPRQDFFCSRVRPTCLIVRDRLGGEDNFRLRVLEINGLRFLGLWEI